MNFTLFSSKGKYLNQGRPQRNSTFLNEPYPEFFINERTSFLMTRLVSLSDHIFQLFCHYIHFVTCIVFTKRKTNSNQIRVVTYSSYYVAARIGSGGTCTPAAC